MGMWKEPAAPTVSLRHSTSLLPFKRLHLPTCGMVSSLKQTLIDPFVSTLQTNPHGKICIVIGVRHIAALEMIPSKKSYMEAFKHSTELVETESNPLHFLRTEEFNPWQGAKRLALHWYVPVFLFVCRTTLYSPSLGFSLT